MPETVGFIGLGLMGKPMAANLLKVGYPAVHRRNLAAGRGEDDNSIMAKTVFDIAGIK